jgi:hypothetical protein
MTKKYWNPYVAGVGLGLVLLTSFVVTGKGLGGSGAFRRASAAVLHAANPTWAEEHGNMAGYFSPERGPLDNWIVFLSLGVAIGGLAGAVTGGRVKVETVRGPRMSRNTRWVLALVGGVVSGVAAQIARGCTSGQALTGGAQLALGSWVFMFAVFGAAYALAYVVRKEWI